MIYNFHRRSYLLTRYFKIHSTNTRTAIAIAITSMIPRLRIRLSEPSFSTVSCVSSSGVKSSSAFSSYSLSCSSLRVVASDYESQSSHSVPKSNPKVDERALVICSVFKNSISARFFIDLRKIYALFGKLSCQFDIKTANCNRLTILHRYFKL